jgi:hypothetical protein
MNSTALQRRMMVLALDYDAGRMKSVGLESWAGGVVMITWVLGVRTLVGCWGSGWEGKGERDGQGKDMCRCHTAETIFMPLCL